jgi:uncharacterized protein (DUF885 family)
VKRSIEEIAADYWEGTLRAHPERASALGDHRFDDRLEDLSSGGSARESSRLLDLRRELEGLEVTGEERLTRDVLHVQVRNDLALQRCAFWALDPYEGPVATLLGLEDHEKRWPAVVPYLEAHMLNLAQVFTRGLIATRRAMLLVIEQIDQVLARPLGEWPLSWETKPSFERLRRLLHETLLPHARSDERAGLAHLGEWGVEAYRLLVRAHTSLELSPEEIHALGEREVARAQAELEPLRGLVERARSECFASREEVLAFATETVARASRVAPSLFGRLPKAPCTVVPVPSREEHLASFGAYLEPGVFQVNTSRPRERRRFEAQALAFHEAVPGHHVQIALAGELESLPAFRRHASFTAYLEGWALYAERLAAEAGLYSSDLDRLGMVAFDLWRSARLVVDTGIHALGWPLERAREYLRAKTLLDEKTIGEELDRYTICPAQALAYKLGQLEIVSIREEARKAPGFDLRAFHDRVLEAGPLPLPLLRARFT